MTDRLGRISYGGEKIDYEVVFRSTRTTLAIEVHPDGLVRVRAPAGCPADQIAERVRRRANWIRQQRAGFARYEPRTSPRRYVNGESHKYLGRQYRLKIVKSGRAGVRMTRDRLVVSVPDPGRLRQVRATLQSWYRGRARLLFVEVLEAGLRRFEEIERPRLVLRVMESRWGSLSRAGTLTLNTDLVRAPRECIEYVVVHELCHLKYRDHDAAFYRLLERILPDWAKRKGRLEQALS